MIDINKIEPYNFITEIESLNLSTKALNILKASNLNTIEDIVRYRNNFKSFTLLKKCGKKTSEELEHFYKNYVTTSHKLDDNIAENKGNDENIKIINRINSLFKISIEDYYTNIDLLINNKLILIFKLLEVIFSKSKLLDKIEKEIIKIYYETETIISLEYIAKKTKLSKERIRQKKKLLEDKIFNKKSSINLLIQIIFDLIDRKDIFFSEKLILIDNKFVNYINNKNETSFSIDFIINILMIINPNYELFDCKYCNKYNKMKYNFIKNKYLIINNNFNYITNWAKFLKIKLESKREKDICFTKHDILNNISKSYRDSFCLLLRIIEKNNIREAEAIVSLKTKLFKNLFQILSGKTCQGVYNKENNIIYINKGEKFTLHRLTNINIDENINLDWTVQPKLNNIILDNYNDYLINKNKIKTDFLDKINVETHKYNNQYIDLFEAIKLFTFFEFNIVFENEELKINYNTEKSLISIIEDIFKEYNKPLHLDDIITELNKKGIDNFKNKDNLRNRLCSNNKFCSIGKTSTYVLKEWTNVNILNIREIVEEYLLKQQKPIHISEITNYVKQFRNIYKRSLISNIKSDIKRFIVSDSQYVSLKINTSSNKENNHKQLKLF